MNRGEEYGMDRREEKKTHRICPCLVCNTKDGAQTFELFRRAALLEGFGRNTGLCCAFLLRPVSALLNLKLPFSSPPLLSPSTKP